MKTKNKNLVSGMESWIGRHRWLPLLPVFIYLFLFFVIPISRALYKSFWDPTFTIEHYVRFFTEPVYLKVVFNSFKTAFTVTFFSLLLGYPSAFFLSSIPERVANKLFVFVLLPFWTSLLVRNYAWVIILGRNGLLNSVLIKIGLISDPIKLLYTFTSVNIGMVHVLLPYMILSLYAVMKGIDRKLMIAAQSLGAGRFQTFVKVFLPLSLPGVGGGCLLVFIMSVGFFITPALLGGPRNTMIAQLIQQNVDVLLNWGFAFAGAFVLLLFTLLILIIYNKFFSLGRMWGGE